MRKKKDAVHGETQGSLVWHEVIDEVSRAFWGKELGILSCWQQGAIKRSSRIQVIFFNNLSDCCEENGKEKGNVQNR